ncbi:MAG TPA: hypothetical protein VFF44_10270 [Casimicrobiaceae bacterium]|nr:hypothetical protein [Casimicrobiaceae bacterium]
MRRSRRWLSVVMILGFACAQLISLAHACAGDSETIGPAGSSAHTAAMPADCPMMADDSSMSGPACGAHCLPHEQADRGADVRIAALGPPAVLVFRAVRPVVAAAMRAMPPLARIASPPQSLRFGRFLI